MAPADDDGIDDEDEADGGGRDDGDGAEEIEMGTASGSGLNGKRGSNVVGCADCCCCCSLPGGPE